MAITNKQQTQILKIVIGLFNGGIGTSNLTALATLVDNGMTMSDLSDQLARIPLFTDNIMGVKVTIQSQVIVMMNHFGVVADSDPELEDLECANKAKALLAAVEPARRMSRAKQS